MLAWHVCTHWRSTSSISRKNTSSRNLFKGRLCASVKKKKNLVAEPVQRLCASVKKDLTELCGPLCVCVCVRVCACVCVCCIPTQDPLMRGLLRGGGTA